MNILYLGLPGNPTSWLRRNYDDFVTAVAGRFAIRLYDFRSSVREQFEAIEAVVEAGGSFATREMIDEAASQRVKLWQIMGTGMDHVDVTYFSQRAVPLAHTPGLYSSVPLAEHALFMMLFFEKSYRQSQNMLRARLLCEPTNGELLDKTLGLIGFGASGQELAKRVWPLGMQAIAIDVATVPKEVCDRLHVKFLGGPEQLSRLLRESDFISIHVPLNETTRHMIHRESFQLMKPSAVIINVARSEIIEQEALIAALKTGQIKGAGLDVFPKEPVDPDHPLLQLENVLATPHIAGATSGTSRRRALAAAENIMRISRGLSPQHLVY
jgi:phosphoglycerate dehydrogenase-like enzyme